jgi:hypothetical protein
MRPRARLLSGTGVGWSPPRLRLPRPHDNSGRQLTAYPSCVIRDAPDGAPREVGKIEAAS